MKLEKASKNLGSNPHANESTNLILSTLKKTFILKLKILKLFYNWKWWGITHSTAIAQSRFSYIETSLFSFFKFIYLCYGPHPKKSLGASRGNAFTGPGGGLVFTKRNVC